MPEALLLPALSGHFNRSLFPASAPASQLASHSIVTWNARALACRNEKTKQRKLGLLIAVARNASVTFVQEAHGSIQELRRLLHWFENDFYVVISPGRDRGTAGVVTIIKKELANNTIPSSSFYDDGRVIRTEIVSTAGSAIYWNAHNYNIRLVDVRRATDHLGADVLAAKSDPTSTVVWVGGDFKCLASGDIPLSIASPGRKRDMHASKQQTDSQRQ